MKAFNWSQRQLLQRRTKVFMVLLTQSDMTDWQSKIEEKQTSHTVCRGQTQIQRSLGKGMKGSLLTSCPGIASSSLSPQSAADHTRGHFAQIQLTMPSALKEICSRLSTLLPPEEIWKRNISTRFEKHPLLKSAFCTQIDMDLPAKIFILISRYFPMELKNIEKLSKSYSKKMRPLFCRCLQEQRVTKCILKSWKLETSPFITKEEKYLAEIWNGLCTSIMTLVSVTEWELGVLSWFFRSYAGKSLLEMCLKRWN